MKNSKIQHQYIFTQNRVLKNTIIHQTKVELHGRIQNQERENNHFFKREWEEKKVKMNDIVINTKLSKSC